MIFKKGNKGKTKTIIVDKISLGKLEKLGLLEALECIESTVPRVKITLLDSVAAEKHGYSDAPRTCVCDNERQYNGYNCRTRYKKLSNGCVVVVSDLS